jgi:hypothetical protein
MKKQIAFLTLVILAVGSTSLFASPPPTGTTPDSGSTMMMLGAGATGLAWVCKRLRR